MHSRNGDFTRPSLARILLLELVFVGGLFGILWIALGWAGPRLFAPLSALSSLSAGRFVAFILFVEASLFFGAAAGAVGWALVMRRVLPADVLEDCLTRPRVPGVSSLLARLLRLVAHP